jgi:hypothetical protein
LSARKSITLLLVISVIFLLSLTTSFWVYYQQTPGSPPSNAYRPVGIATSGSDGMASLSYRPAFAGTYYWYITVYLKAPGSGWSVLR